MLALWLQFYHKVKGGVGLSPWGRGPRYTDCMERKPTPLFRNKDYLLLWSGQIVSSVGTQTTLLALPLLVLIMTNSPLQAGLVGAIRLLPYLLLSLPAGALADRWNRKRMMILSDTVRMIALASIPVAFLFGGPSLVQLYIVSLVEGTFYVFFDIAQVASLPNVVEKEQLPAAAVQNVMIFGTSIMLGPFLGGLLYGVKEFVRFLVDPITYAGSVVSLSFIKRDFQKQRTAVPNKVGIEIRDGLLWLWRQPLVFFLALLAFSVQLIGSSTQHALIVDAHQFKSTTPFLIGLIFLLGGIGGMVGSIAGGTLQKRFRPWSITLGAQVVIIVSWAFYAIANNAILLGLISIFVFAGFGAYNVVQFSYRLAIIPDHLQGRVNSVFRLIAFAGDPLGLLLAGLLLQTIGVVPTILAAWGFLIVIAVITALNPHVRKATLISQIRAQETPLPEAALAEASLAETAFPEGGLAEVLLPEVSLPEA